MWNNYDDDVNECGEAVQLYLPRKSGPRRTNTDFVDSHIGGTAHAQESPVCGACQNSMKLLVQLRLPNTSSSDGTKVDRIIFVFACARASCFENVQFVNGFAAVGESGVLSCQTVETPSVVVTSPPVPVAPTKSSWYTDDGDDDNDNDWGVSGNNGNKGEDGDDNFADLERAVSAMEQNLLAGALAKQSKKPDMKTSPSVNHADGFSASSFPCFLLTKQMEPPAPIPGREEDDVGLSASDEKIRNMLAKYLAEEEDEDILAALKGADIGGGGGGEEDERLTEKERLLLGFQDRLRRAPQQVVRYAKGGSPLWSIPSNRNGERLWKNPECATCGTTCDFEMQLLPSLLHVLKVDQFSPAGESAAVGIEDLLSKGMNWGSVAVFTCTNTDCTLHKGALVMQASLDENPKHTPTDQKRHLAPTMAVMEDLDDDDDFELYVN